MAGGQDQMKQIVVISGKGGTGKTVLTASFAALAINKVMVDCDVDAADLHLLLQPEIKERHEFRSGVTARIDAKICEQCGQCISVCRFNATSETVGKGDGREGREKLCDHRWPSRHWLSGHCFHHGS